MIKNFAQVEKRKRFTNNRNRIFPLEL